MPRRFRFPLLPPGVADDNNGVRSIVRRTEGGALSTLAEGRSSGGTTTAATHHERRSWPFFLRAARERERDEKVTSGDDVTRECARLICRVRSRDDDDDGPRNQSRASLRPRHISPRQQRPNMRAVRDDGYRATTEEAPSRNCQGDRRHHHRRRRRHHRRSA